VVDLVRTDARRGITLAKKVADLCDAFNMNCELHSWGSCVSQAANVHVMCAIHNCDFFEKSVPEEQFEVLAKNPIRIDAEGFVRPPEGPGHGLELDWDEVQRRTSVEM
jgi:L-alanine-DL-glutamate epimerase-like enolase superfamily enzyme